jgi:enoyl-CoA hydratase/carnithine racemase
MLEAVGWSGTMRYALTGDELDAGNAHDMHLVQELVEPGTQLTRALELAERMAAQPPLAISALVEHAREALELGRRAAIAHTPAVARMLLNTEDAREAALALLERRAGVFRGC